MVNEIDLLLNRIKDLQDRVRVIEASLSTGQQSYDSITVAANYSHVHRRSSILDLTVDSDIDHDALTNFVANEHIDWTNASENFKTSKASALMEIEATSVASGGETILLIDSQSAGQAGAFEITSGLGGKLRLGVGSSTYLASQGDMLFFTHATNFGTVNIPATLRLTIKSTGAFEFEAVDVNFGGGTTYKIEADGDAYFKEIYLATGQKLHLGTSYLAESGGNVNIDPSGTYCSLLDGAKFAFLSAGNDKHIEIYHDDTDAIFNVPAGDGGLITKINGSNRIKVTSAGLIQLGDAGVTNYAQFAADGELNLFGTARVIRDAWIPFNAIRAPGTKPATYVDHGISGAWEFSDATDDTIVGNIKFPNDMDHSIAPSVCVGWSTNTAVDTETAVWQLEYLYTQVGEDTSAAAQATITVDSNAIAQADGLILAVFPAMDIPHADDVCIHFRIKRLGADGNDDLTDTTELHGIVMRYTSNKLGTAT